MCKIMTKSNKKLVRTKIDILDRSCTQLTLEQNYYSPTKIRFEKIVILDRESDTQLMRVKIMTKSNEKQVRTKTVLLDRENGTRLERVQNYDEVEQKTSSNKKWSYIRQRKWHTKHACAKNGSQGKSRFKQK